MRTVLDRDLVEAFEQTETTMHRQHLARYVTYEPGGDFADMSRDGGQALFAGHLSPLSYASGFGLPRRANENDLAAIESFYDQFDMPARIEVTSFSDPTWLSVLAHHGYCLDHFTHVWYKPLCSRPHHFFPPVGSIEIVEENTPLVPQWAHIVASGFKIDGPPSLDDITFATCFLQHDSSTGVLAKVHGVWGAAAAISIQGPIAMLFAASTQLTHRNQGLHHMLIAKRLEMAAEAHCEWAIMQTDPGSASERHASELGFVMGYTKAMMVVPMATS
ncbi:MAG: hypothetical protein OWR62_01070 [Sulfobacillus thermotolerans]|uniref:N-acetyltransferase domain-containing protein n=1 Tax=Sulfobacillus thermotolerans TaxID=338644 RepID=A0ABM6RQ78_9FIRM|nr:hypothetical protein BXT84_05075 [Sulfobacillus thermotolerans]MCY0906961.1 hypothetical protein [Sulfobacillus thermotolerans]